MDTIVNADLKNIREMQAREREEKEALQHKTLCLDDKGILWQLESTLREMRVSRPNERSERSRRYAVAITEMEKVVSYFKVYVADSKQDNTSLPSVTDQPCHCSRCDWHGIVLDCENDVDGNLICPECPSYAVQVEKE